MIEDTSTLIAPMALRGRRCVREHGATPRSCLPTIPGRTDEGTDRGHESAGHVLTATRKRGTRHSAHAAQGTTPTESLKLMAAAASITATASALTMAAEMAAMWCATNNLGDAREMP